LPSCSNAPKVVFAARVVVFGEAVERRHALGDFHCGNQAKVANAARHHLLAKADGYRIPAGTRQIQPEFRTGLMHQKIATGSTAAHVANVLRYAPKSAVGGYRTF
jgi:hypothetical protein